MELKEVQTTVRELARSFRRIARIIEAEEHYNAFICRSADDCWSYPGADEKYEMYLDRMGSSDERLELLRDAQEPLEKALEKMELLQVKLERL